MAAATGPRKTVSIYDYPEHLNPFREEDNHNKIRFWTIGRKLNRSNSINFSSIKDLKNSWAFRSFMKKGKRDQQPTANEKPQLNGDGGSPLVFRRALQNSSATNGSLARSTMASPERADRYVYGGSVTPLPRSRFQERLRATSHNEVSSLSGTPRLARSEVMGSRLSVTSTNPFEDEAPTPPVRAARRKKKRAPPPPSPLAGNQDTVSSPGSELQITDSDVQNGNNNDTEPELENMNFSIELKIIEDEDVKSKEVYDNTNRLGNNNDENKLPSRTEKDIDESKLTSSTEKDNKDSSLVQSEIDDIELKIETESTTAIETNNKNSGSEEDILNKVSFPKVDIVKYRRNSSVNEDDIRLRRGNLEDFQSLSSKRSKSLTNALNESYLVYDINLNEDKLENDKNGNNEPQKVVCKLYDDTTRKQSIDTVSSTEKEFIEIDRATRELEREISKLNSALNDDDDLMTGARLSVSDIKRRFDKNDTNSPNPIPKPRRSHYGSPTNGNIPA